MSLPLRVLLIEDSADDAELVLRQLRSAGYEPSYSRVESMEGLEAALRGGTWDVVLSDHALPGFSGLKALEVVREFDPDIPFIVVSGTMGEDAAVAEMKAGAHDYVMKDNLARLPAAVEREIREAEVRREHQRAERALRESEQRYRKLVEASPDAIYVYVVRDERIVLVNSAAVRLFAAPSPEAILGRSPFDLIHPSFHSVVRERIASMARSGEPVPTIEEQIVRCDGALVDVEVTGAPFSDKGARSIQVILRDVTARKQAERELREALRKAEESDRLKHAFLANMSHEIRTPLNVILGFAGILVEGLSPAQERENVQIVEGIERATRRLIGTVHAILDMSKLETETFEIRPAPVAVEPLLRREVKTIRKLAEEKGLTVSCESEAPDAVVRFDEYCLSRALASLLDNAVKFTDRGQVAVRLFRDAQGELSVEIRDTGVGIDPAYLPRMFQPFSQEDVGYTRRFEGPGLGLRLAWHYLDLNGARLDAESEKGQGSVFRIRFPKQLQRQEALGGNLAAVARGPEPALTPPPAPEEAREKRVVLVVEDDPASQVLMRQILAKRYDVLLAASAEEARERIRAHGAALHAVLMDISLKGPEDGLSLTRALRRDARTESVPIIAVTAHALEDDRRQALEAGCTAYLAKPFRREELLALLEA